MPRSEFPAPVTITVGLDEVVVFPLEFGDGIMREVAISLRREVGVDGRSNGDSRRRVTARAVVGGETVMRRDQGRM